jgi:hypothetical protein
MSNVTSLSDYRSKKEGERIFNFRIGKFSEHRIALLWEDPTSCLTLDRYNFEKAIQRIRKTMGWPDP